MMSNQIDTRGVLGKIAVMQAFAKGSPIESINRDTKMWSRAWVPTWDWVHQNYRIQELADDEIIIVTYEGNGVTGSARPRTSYAEAYDYMDKLRTQGFTVSHRVYKEKV